MYRERSDLPASVLERALEKVGGHDECELSREIVVWMAKEYLSILDDDHYGEGLDRLPTEILREAMADWNDYNTNTTQNELVRWLAGKYLAKRRDGYS